jgi:hypothetical protein
MNTAMKRTLATAGWTLMLAMIGCDGGTASTERTGTPRARATTDFASRRIDAAGLAEVQPVADRVFRSYFRIDTTVSSATDLVAFPTDVKSQEVAGRAEEPAAETPGERPPRDTVGDVIGVSPRRYRRLAELRLAVTGNGVVAQVRVMFQRLTTAERTAFARERGDDRPTDTAIDRLGPGSPAAREEWRDDRRDRKLEQEILGAIQAGMAATQPAGG